ncbi:hypothetical protein WR164_00490 [Philodulcilactobacillus myokoensis]|uniref:ABC transporter permease n=1 Tax=Philodulcilactobacillus myokoensis TaxID=2929573 RepID=A0A9W6ERC9_9LACO|nr:hypothetical protein [Philodulcilactobacillus myokoensis]GLB46070.1 hypothetical protein WR164_00490 [Philodulcilactobacillus myokoensis]
MTNDDLKYEISNFKKTFKSTFIISLLIQLLILIFFFMVGYLDRESDDSIFEHFNSLIGFSSLLSALLISIYISVRSVKYIISNYMGDNKVFLYLYPNGRTGIFQTKLCAFLLVSILAQLVGSFLVNILFLIFSRITNVLPPDVNYIGFIAVTFAVVLLSLFVITTSIVIGVRLSSKVATVISSIILVAILCNPLSFLCAYSAYTSLLCAVILVFVSLILVQYCKHYLKNDEVLR